MTSSPVPWLTRLNTSDTGTASALLHAVCASRSWCAEVAARRPYADVEALHASSDGATRRLTAEDLAEAMAGHPPIGRPAPGDPAFAREQGGVRDSQREELLGLNLAYQEIHGHVFLICATGRTGDQMLAALRERIGNDPVTEREIVRTELGRINRVRLTRLTEGER